MENGQSSPRIRPAALLSAGLILFTLAIGIVVGTLVSDGAGAADDGTAAAPDATPLVIPDEQPVENQFTPIVKAVRSSVVNILVEATPREESAVSEGGGGEGKEGMEDFFRRFFGMPNAPGGFEAPSPRRRPGEGSGFIVDPKGYIITNNHVVADADRVRVRFAGEDDFFDAKVIGTDEETDLAVIKIDASRHKLSPAKLGNSEAVGVGDWAIAIGSPFGFRETVTVGIISAKSREVQGPSAYSRPFQKFFQTDAAINPGNSGGPLVNIRGEVIGINTAIVSRSGSYEGLGFALPSNVAVEVYNQIIKLGRVARGSIGISFNGAQTDALLRQYGAEHGGVFVTGVTVGWPAAKAGIKAEDVIVGIDDAAITDGDQLIDVVAHKPVGSSIQVALLRNGEQMTLPVDIADREELLNATYGVEDEPKPAESGSSDVDLGIKVRNLTDARKQQLDYEGDEGVLIDEVTPASFAEDLGLQPEDVIVAVNRQPVTTVTELTKLRAAIKSGDDVAFKIMRRMPSGWTTLYLADVLPAHKGP